MGSSIIFLLLYAGLISLGCVQSAEQNQTCGTSAGITSGQCTHMSNSTRNFLSCAGVPSELEADHVLNLKGLISAALDVYTFMRSSMSGIPVLDLSGGVTLDEDHVIKAWLDVRLTPLLSSISRNFLTCLSNRNFSCNAYQTVVRELSQHFSNLDPVKQKWIYSFFMYPFLSRNTSSGCVDPEASSEDWLMRNFGSFSVMAQVRDFTSINMLFSGLEVLHLLTQEQKAELLLYPEMVGLTDSSLSLVFQSLLSSLQSSENHQPSDNGTMFYMSNGPSASMQDPLRQALNGFMTAFRPVGSFVHNFVSLTQQQNLGSMRSATLMQAMINLTLAEIAAPFKQQNLTAELQDEFDPTNIDDWFTYVVSPMLRRFLPGDLAEIPSNLTAVFHKQFYIENGVGSEVQNESQDICSVSIDDRTCALTDLVEHVSTILNCAARSNFTLTEETLLEVLLHLSQNLNALLQQLSMTNFSSQSPYFGDILNQIDNTFTMQSLQDESFIRLWFQVKLKPLLSTLTPEYLTCLSHKEFSCQTFQLLVSELSDNMFLMSGEGPQDVYRYFIFSYSSLKNASGGCPAENSSVWVTQNLGGFSHFAMLMEMYQLNPDFNAIDAIPVLSPNQLAELIVENFPGLPEKSVIINLVFDYILISPVERGLFEMLEHLIMLAGEMGLECSSYQLIVQRLEESLLLHNMMEPIQENIALMKKMAPSGCFPPPFTCISSPVNETSVCFGVYGDELNSLLSAGLISVSCNISLDQYACSPLNDFTAVNLADLLMCQLSSNSTSSKEIWKLLFTKTDKVLDQALVIFSSMSENMTQPIRSESLSYVLDVIAELRLEQLSPDQWNVWFDQNLKAFLPYASSTLLQCIISKNLSCQTYQQLLQAFDIQFHLMDEFQRRNMVEFFILPFFRRNTTDPGCVLSSNNSTEWLQMNFGLFVQLVFLRDLLFIDPLFNPLETLSYLSAEQMVELMVDDLPELTEKDLIINEVFDYLLVSPEERGLPDVLEIVLIRSQTTFIPCSSYLLIFEKLFNASSSLPSHVETLVLQTTEELKQNGAKGCELPQPPTCISTLVNATKVCEGVNSDELNSLLSAGLMSVSCNISLDQYACSPLNDFTAVNLADLLMCQLSSNSTSSKEFWKLLFTKTDKVLDQALVIFSSMSENMTQPIRSESLSHVLDVITELRLEQLSPDQWNVWFDQNLKAFLPYASSTLLQCIISKNLSCQTYQQLLQAFDIQFHLMDEFQRRNMVEFFIFPFLRRNTTDPGCVLSSNSSTEWLQMNFGLFVQLVSLRDLLFIDPLFNPLETLSYLSAEQMVELMVDDLPELTEKDLIINEVFDYLLVSPEERGLPDVLEIVLIRSQTTFIPCSSYLLIFEKLFNASSSLPSHVETLVLQTTEELKQNGAKGCELPQPPTCISTLVNATKVCEGVNSDELNSLLSAGLLSVSCNISLDQYACSPFNDFTAVNLADLLMCQLSSNSTSSKEIWKLLFTKTDKVLDKALVIFSSMSENMTQPIRSESLSYVLDVIAELRLEQLSPDQWNVWFDQNLKAFLPYASSTLLQCIISKNLSCQTYQQLLQAFDIQFHLMDEFQRRNMVEFFILPFFRRNTTDPGCMLSSNNSTEWLQMNFGLFVQLVSLRDLLFIDPLFNPLETLSYLSAEQMVELMVDDLPELTEKDLIINEVFDYLLVSPEERGLPDVLEIVLIRSQTTFIPCSSYLLIFEKLFNASSSLPSHVETLVLQTTEELKQNGAKGCELPQPPTCISTLVNATRVCEGVNSDELNSLLSAGLISVSCNISLDQYACSPFNDFTAVNLADLLMCQLSSNSTSSKEIWKLLFTKTDKVLDQALVIFSSMSENMTQPIRSESLSHVLDVITELRLEQLSPDQWNVWFDQNLKAFLPYASSTLLQCIISKNLSCQTYQQLLQAFDIQFHLMDEFQRRNMVEFFIFPFLRRNTTDPGCVLSSNNSTEWLQMNFGLFVQLVSLRDLLFIDPLFNPLETLSYLSAEQMVELMVDDLPELTEKDLIINEVFDYLLVSPVERGLPDVLQLLFASSKMNPLSCQSNQIIFMKLEQILIRSPGDLEPVIWMSLYNFNSTAPAGCSLLPVLNECQLIPYNATQVCSGVDSSSLQQYLNNPNTTQTFCDFSIGQYACTPMLSISVKDLVSILDCQRSEDVMSSPETWKLFLIRVSHLLDSALYTIYNTSMWWSDPSGSVILDVLRELRLDRLTDDGIIATWLDERLRPFLPFTSGAFLQCLSGKNFSCLNFQTIVAAFDAGFDHMDELQRQTTLTEFILPFITTADVPCSFNDSTQWLISNFGQFSTLLTLNQLIALNPQLNLLEILDYLSPEQLAGLMVDDLPDLPEKAVVINTVFNHLAGSPQKIPDVLYSLVYMSKMNNISCVSYQAIFHRLDHLLVSVSVDLETIILRSRTALLQNVPQGCMSYSGECDITPVNETAVCSNVNSSALLAYLNSPHNGSQLCDFSITQYSCTELTDLSSQDLATVLLCSFRGNENVSEETWKLFVQKVNPVMGPALDRLSDTILNKSRLSVSFLNMIGEVTLSTFGSSSLQNDLFVQRWFNSRLRPFLPHSSEAFLSCLSTKNFSCDTFRTVVNSFSQSYDLMSTDTQVNVYVDFIKGFLSLNSTEGCVDGTESSSDWLMMNFGDFYVFTTINDLQTINPSFNVWDTLSLLSIRQLVEVSSTPGLLSTSAEAYQLLSIIPDNQLTTFYTSLSTALQVQDVSLPPPVQEVFVQQVFDRANLTTISDADLQIWILDILPPFITNITVQHVTAYFSVLQGRPCNISQQGVQLLNSSISTFQPATQDQIYQQILNSLQGPNPLRCYGNQSFFSFLQSSFMSFQFPNLSTFLLLMPPGRVPELMDSISPAEVSTLLSRPGAMDDVTKVCQLLSSYPKTPQYLETEPVLSTALARQMLSCVWSQVLRVVNRSEVDQWFDHRLVHYLPFLTSQLIAPDVMRDSSCVSFSKFVSVMGKYNYSAVDFSQRDIYRIIQVYLNTTSTPKCYNTSQPDLNSTAWFANYIGTFASYITLDDLTLLFGSSQLQPFTVNLENLQLFNNVSIPDDVVEFYVTLLFQENPNFNAFNLPVKFRCLAPVSSFRRMTMEQLHSVSPSVHQNCKNITPDVSAALASNADVLTLDSIQALGQSCIGLSTAQLSSAGPQVLLNALSVFSTVIGWNQDQAMTIIQILLSSNLYQINSASSLQGLGSLIIGVSSSVINFMPSNEVLMSVQSASFVTNAIASPVIVQQTIVNQIIAVNTSPDIIAANVPDVMATEIPRIFLIELSPAVAQTINHKKWKNEQAILLFETVAMKISDPDTISFQVLQGFTCTRVQSFTTLQINNLIRGCRRRGNEMVVLQESQLTCMYYYIKSADPSAFSQYPAETLLYYDYSLIQTSLCPSYFSALGKADFSVLSGTLSFKKQTLFNNAKGCLGISGFYISREQLDVLGNMCCILSADYIVNSDPYVLEKLKECPDLSDEQTSAIETLLLTGRTSYGSSDAWNRTTLDNLGSLSLYFTSNIWGKFTQPIKQQFQKTFIRGLRKNDKDLEKKLMKMMKESSKSSRAKRATVTECTVGQITQVEVYSDMFPFDYDVTQFNVCLSLQTVKFNLAAMTDKVYDPQYQRIVLDKLNQVYPGGLSDEVLQVLGPTSRVATPSDITMWNVTKIDTLASLMNSRNGDWDPVLVALIVSKYLSVNGNSLGIAELNSLGSNVCALDTNVLNSITTASVERAAALALTNCTLEKKRIMFSIAHSAFIPTNRRGADSISLTTYQLIQSYLGGANTTFVYKLVNSNVNMDVPTFTNLDQSVINVLNVTNVKNLLGVNVGDLKTYESTPQIQEWIKLQLQSDLDTLKIGLKGGRNATVTTAKPSVTISTTTGKVTVAATGAGFRVWPPVCLQLLLLAVTMMLLH